MKKKLFKELEVFNIFSSIMMITKKILYTFKELSIISHVDLLQYHKVN